MSTIENTANKDFIRRASSSVFNYWFGYVANISLVVWLSSQAFSGGVSTLDLRSWATYIVGGLFLWTFFEYFLHKILYHELKTPIKVGHDLHHDEPRALLGVPWYLTTVILIALYFLLASIFNPAATGVVMSFTWLGYIGYCFVHHAIHHFNWKNKWFVEARRHHLVHHAKDNVNWGITTDLWDRILGTKQ